MAEVQELLDFPPAPNLRVSDGQARPAGKFRGGTPRDCCGPGVFFGKAQCSNCHPAPFYTDNLMHDLRVERFYRPQMINAWWQRPRGRSRRSPPARHQGVAAVPARRPAAHAGGHRRVLQPDPGNQPDQPREARPGGVPAAVVIALPRSKEENRRTHGPLTTIPDDAAVLLRRPAGLGAWRHLPSARMRPALRSRTCRGPNSSTTGTRRRISWSSAPARM